MRLVAPCRSLTLFALLAACSALALPLHGSSGDDDKAIIDELQDVVRELTNLAEHHRRQAAAAELRAADAERELAELRQFVADHGEFGKDFDSYKSIKAIREKEAAARRADELAAQREANRTAERERRAAARAERMRGAEERDRSERLDRAGFSHVGDEIWAGRMGYRFASRTTPGVEIEYDTYLGLYYQPTRATTEVDFSRMTISGSIVSMAAGERNVGVAITFFDAHGNQVGSEVIRINNARPTVPYPFSSTLDMALDRPFSSSSVHVLYADPVAPSGDEAP